jgi:beta-galactosidase
MLEYLMRRTVSFVFALLATAAVARADRTTLNFDADWRFFRGEPPATPTTVPNFVNNGNYAPIDPPSHAFKDDTWRKVDLPHDWSIEGPFDQNAPTMAAGGFLPSGVGWYRKTFTVPADAKGKKVFIEFDGVMANSEVFLNKSLLGKRPNGYVPFRYDMTDALNYGGPNVIAVRTDTSRQPSSRWYSGAGIYRHTRMVIQEPVHLEQGATVVTALNLNENGGTVRIQTMVINQSASPREISVMATVFGPPRSAPDGAYAKAGESRPQTIAPGSSAQITIDVPFDWALWRWSIDQPNMHSTLVRVLSGGQALDNETVSFGIRTIEYKPDTGFWLNGKNMKMLGVCLHHDVGALGAAVPASAWESRLTALKARGVNAIRAAHAPMSPEFYAACDKLGMLVMDEAFDVWTIGKMSGDYHLYFKDWWQRDLEAIMKSHRNHPSIVIWSLGNEIWDILSQNPDPAADQFQGPKRSIDVAKNILIPMCDYARTLDATRPLTLAVMRPNENGTYTNGFSEILDVVGQNYRDNELAAAHRQNPQRKIIGTENYKTRETWIALRDNPALAGQFLWAGVDYLGEAAAWPNFTSPSGILDRTNYPKGEAFEREAWWSTKPVVHIVRMGTAPARPGRPAVTMGYPDWTPADTSGNVAVNVYSNCDEVELFLNGQSLGAKPRDPNDVARAWQVPYAAGTLRAVAKNKGAVVATEEIKSAGAASKIVLQAERTTLPNDYDDVVYVRAFLSDASGTHNPNATGKIKFTVAGPGKIVAVDNGDLASHEPFQASERSAFQGTCIAILRATADSGKITLTASAEGLADGTVTIDAAPRAR